MATATAYDEGKEPGGRRASAPQQTDSRLIAQQQLAAIVAATDDAIFSKDLEGRITSWNAGAEKMYGYTADEIVGRDVSILIPDDRKQEERMILERLSRGERVEPYETERLRADGIRIDVALTVSPIRDDDGSPIGGAIIARDITTAKRYRQTQEFLARAGAALDASLDPIETLRTIAATAVPDLAELCVIDLLSDDGVFEASVAAAADPALARELERIRMNSPLDPAGQHPVAQVMRAGRSMVWRDLTMPEVVDDVAQSDDHRAFVERAGYRSAIVAPMTARGRTLGGLSLLHVANDRRYDANDIALIDDLAARAAIAYDNARLYAERDHIAQVLQRGLVPERPAEIPGIELGLAFEPAGAGIEMGGDFFDVISRPSDSLVIIGDVAGRGSEAVSLTALVRHSVRTVALDLESPLDILRKVNDVMLASPAEGDPPRFVTAILGRIKRTAESVALSVCCAGHPPALVVRGDGTIDTVGRGGLLGIFASPELREEEIALEPGDTVILYTDGLLEAGSVADHLSVEQLAGLVLKAAGAPPPTVVERLRDDAFARSRGKLADDLLVLALRRT